MDIQKAISCHLAHRKEMESQVDQDISIDFQDASIMENLEYPPPYHQLFPDWSKPKSRTVTTGCLLISAAITMFIGAAFIIAAIIIINSASEETGNDSMLYRLERSYRKIYAATTAHNAEILELRRAVNLTVKN